MIKIIPVYKGLAGDLPAIDRYIQDGLEYNPFMAWPDLLDLIRRGDAWLYVFIARDTGACEGACVTEILQAPSGSRHFNILALGASAKAYEDRLEILAQLEEEARRAKCSRIFASGRQGWKLLATEAGWECQKQITFWKDLIT